MACMAASGTRPVMFADDFTDEKCSRMNSEVYRATRCSDSEKEQEDASSSTRLREGAAICRYWLRGERKEEKGECRTTNELWDESNYV